MLNFVYLVLGVGGAIVGALTLADPLLKWAVIVFFGLIGLIGFGLIVNDWWKAREPNASNKVLAQKCDSLARDIKDFALERSMAEPPFFPRDQKPDANTGEEISKRFAERADYSTKTKQLFTYKFGQRLAAINDELKSNGQKPSPHWLWAADAKINEVANHLAVYAQRLKSGQIIDEPDK